ncbi:MAG: prephenate dehydratase [Dermabacter sp.]|nr:prephenate dehydratase [Dermabacter sp.]
MRYGFLGPETTFTHQALLQALDALPALGAAVAREDEGPTEPGGEAQRSLVPYPSVAAAIGDLVAGEVDAMMAPIENSVEGGVSGTLDVLADTAGITIVAEQIVPISFVLAAREQLAFDDVRTVTSHTHAQAQCQRFVRAELPNASPQPALSTAAAARELAELPPGDPRARGAAVICSRLAADHFGLTVIASGIEDFVGAQTRFVLVQRDGRIPARTGADKTTVVAYLAHNRAGALLEMLEVLSAGGVNLSRIESRPAGDSLGRYSFSMDMEGHLEDRRVAAALANLHRVCTRLVFLGSYARADGSVPAVAQHNTDAAYDDAREWMHDLTAQIQRG